MWHLRLNDLPELYNYIEVGLWPTLALVLFGWAFRRKGAARRDAILAAVTLVVFGASDWFEANTGNEWWHPWWLLLWKAGCVLVLLVLVLLAWRRTKCRSPLPPSSSPIPWALTRGSESGERVLPPLIG